MFVKWSCGCKGFIADNKCWVIDNCDKDPQGPYEPLGIYERDMSDRRSILVGREEYNRLTEEELNERVMKTHDPLPYSEVRSLLIEMSRLMSDGYAFRQMQSLLSHKWKPIEKDADE